MSYVQEGKTMNWTNGTGVDVPAGGVILVGTRLGWLSRAARLSSGKSLPGTPAAPRPRWSKQGRGSC